MSKVKTQTHAPVKESSPPVAELTPPTPRKTGGRAPASPQQASSSGLPRPTQAAGILTAPGERAGAASRANTMAFMQRMIGNIRLSRVICTTIQPKLTIGAPDDIYEREADHVAEMMTRQDQKPAARTRSSIAQRQTADSTAKPDKAVGMEMENRIKSPSGGQPLPDGIRREMEPGLGADFSQVRVHNSTKDQADASRLNAKAFTHGSNIWLGPGASANDRKLMAHELTHVVQQGGATPGHTVQPVEQTATTAIMRFAGTEHAALGDTTGATIDLGDGIVLTWGQVVAIAGDEYGTVEELEAAISNPEGKARLRAALKHDGVPGSVTAKLPEPTEAQVSAQDSEFIRLAMENIAHFPDAGAALGMWAEHHARAIDAALLAGIANNPAGISKAYLNEAFGQHFLTDAFSGGHIRTPRAQIVEWYTVNFAPRVVGPLINNLRTRIVEALVAQASSQTLGAGKDILRSMITSEMQASIDTMIAEAGGMAALTRWVGLGVAGAVSGAIHDAEGETGVLVASDEHPTPWRAFGDKKLEDTPISQEQATKAIAAAKNDVDAAYRLGEAEGVTRETAADAPPSRVHFAFNASDLAGPAAQAVQNAAAHLLYHPEAKVEIVGHTDPIGTDAHNEALGLRRAEAVQKALAAAGVATSQIGFHSEGERTLVTTDPKNFRLNRRADFHWRSEPDGLGDGTNPEELALERARAKAEAQFSPPYSNVTRFVPRPVEERGGTGNAPLPDWHWGTLSSATRAQVDDWIRREVGAKLDEAIKKSEKLNDHTVLGITVQPRIVVQVIAAQLLAKPTATVGDLTGEKPGP